MVVGDFDIVGIAGHLQDIRAGGNRRMRRPAKANAITGVDADAVLTVSVSSQCLEPVRRRRAEVGQDDGRLQPGQRFRGRRRDRLEFPNPLAGQEAFCPPVLASDDCRGVVYGTYRMPIKGAERPNRSELLP